MNSFKSVLILIVIYREEYQCTMNILKGPLCNLVGEYIPLFGILHMLQDSLNMISSRCYRNQLYRIALLFITRISYPKIFMTTYDANRCNILDFVSEKLMF